MLVRRLALTIGIFFALVGSQIPEFAQQYRQRLGGALDELNRVIAQFDAEAQGHSLTRAQGLERLKGNADSLASERGAAMEQDIARADRLARQQEAFKTGGTVTRLAALIADFDPATTGRTIADFEPAVPVSFEDFVIAGLALLLGVGATHLVAWPIRRNLRRRGRPLAEVAKG